MNLKKIFDANQPSFKYQLEIESVGKEPEFVLSDKTFLTNERAKNEGVKAAIDYTRGGKYATTVEVLQEIDGSYECVREVPLPEFTLAYLNAKKKYNSSVKSRG